MQIDLRAWCEEQGTTLHALAQKAGIDHSALYRLASGKAEPGPRTIPALIKATGLTYEELFGSEAA